MATRTITILVWLIFCASPSSAQTKQFMCIGTGDASPLRISMVKVITSAQQSEGKMHHAGTSTIGSVGNMTFYVFWDATESVLSVVRKDDDGFEAWATSSDSGIVSLEIKRGEKGARVMCGAK